MSLLESSTKSDGQHVKAVVFSREPGLGFQIDDASSASEQKKTSILDLNLRQGPACSDAPWRRMQFRLRGVNRKLDPRQS